MELTLARAVLNGKVALDATGIQGAQLCSLVAGMIHPSRMIRVDQRELLLQQLDSFPCVTHQQSVMSATAIATWVMLVSYPSETR